MKNKSFFSGFICAARGLAAAFRSERNFRFDIFMALCVILCSLICPLEGWERCVLYTLCALCLFAEGVNSAIERAVDLASPDFNPLAGEAKDIAAGAALICAVFSAAVGLYIFVPYGIDLLVKLFS